MPHQLATELTAFSTRLVGVTQRRQLAEIAADLQRLTLQIDAALVDNADERVVRLTERLVLLERCFNFDRTDDGQTLVVGVVRIKGDHLTITVPAAAGIAQVPFVVASVNAEVVEGDLRIEISTNYA
jgi:hypothetical protein